MEKLPAQSCRIITIRCFYSFLLLVKRFYIAALSCKCFNCYLHHFSRALVVLVFALRGSLVLAAPPFHLSRYFLRGSSFLSFRRVSLKIIWLLKLLHLNVSNDWSYWVVGAFSSPSELASLTNFLIWPLFFNR